MGLLLLAVAAVAMDVSGIFGFRPFTPPAHLDYSAPPFGGFFPLRAPFVSSVLGGSLTEDGRSLSGSGDAENPQRSLGVAVRHPLNNDDVDDAYEIAAIPFTARTDTSRATRERNEPGDCSRLGSSVWYRYRATQDATLIATTSAGYPVALAAYRYPLSRSPRAISCEADAGGAARVVLPAFAGTTYLFQITGQLGGGELVFSLDRHSAVTPVSIRGDGELAGARYDYGIPAVSADGRFVVFSSASTELDPRCAPLKDGTSPCNISQVYIRDLETGVTEMASVTDDGGLPNDWTEKGDVSGDGRYVSFRTRATNVTADRDRPDPDPEFDIFVRDRLLRRTERVTLAKDGSEIHGQDATISDDGRFVAFVGQFDSPSTPRHPYGIQDVYVKDRLTGEVTLASIGNEGQRGNNDSITPQISPDGYYVAFWTRATNLSAGPTVLDQVTNEAGVFQGWVYVYDLRRKRLSFECVSEDGRPTNDHCVGPAISADGKYSLFWSTATNLLPDAPRSVNVNQVVNLYLRDRTTGRLELVNVGDDGTPVGEIYERQISGVRANRLLQPHISADGSIIAFDVLVPLTAGDDNQLVDAYVRDRRRGRTIRISETRTGGNANGQSVFPALSSGDGSLVAFLSEARNLGRPEREDDWDLFARQWRT